MKRILFLILFSGAIAAMAQEVDLVRLAYTKSDITSEQTGMAASADGKYLAFVFKDKTIKIFDVDAARFIKRFTGPFSDLFDLQLTHDGKLVMLQGTEIIVLDWKSEEVLAKFSTTGIITKSSYLVSLNLLAVGQREGWVTIYDLKTRKEVNTFQYKKHHVSALALHPNGKSVAVGVVPILSEFNPLKLFDIKSGDVLAESSKGVYPMAVYNDAGDQLIVSSLNKLGTKTSIFILDGSSLSKVRDVDSKVVWGNAIMPYSGKISQNKLLGITASLSFNVYDLQSGGIVFTTKSDGFKLPSYYTLGIGNANPYPLGNSGKFLINSLGNNISQIYDIKSNSIVGYFYCDSNDDFAVVSRDGRVEGTQEALRKVFWTARSSVIRTSLESTYEMGFTPRLLSQIVSESDLQLATFEVEKVADKIPVVQLKAVNGINTPTNATFTASQKMSKVTLEITQNASEVTELKIYQNSKLIKIEPNQGKSMYQVEVSLTNSFGEQNYFYAAASSKAGIESEKVKFTINYKGATEAKPKLFLLTIGIDKYKNPKYNLNYAQADADGVAKMITLKSQSLFKEIIPYTIRNEKATKATIYAALEQIKSKALEQDMIVVYYAGHGVMSGGTDKEKEFFIVPHDVTQLYGRDEMLFEKAISAADLKKYAQAINAQKQVFILDACQSAGALGALEEQSRGAAEEKAIAQLARSTGTFWITSTGSDQFASEFAKLGHGIFTYALLEGIGGAADVNKDQRLTIRELSTYIENKVPELSEQLKGTAQFPSAYSFGNDFPIAVFEK
ncbi:MAG: caspase family protein [Flammeovirgaceae bacterium]|nr:caspase family protein [Flammeovirgaceae bacterium]